MIEDSTRRLYARVNALLLECSKRRIVATPLKLQKLLYLNYAVHLQRGGGVLEYLKFQAWTYGPVIAPVYYYYKEDRKNNSNDEISTKIGERGVYPVLLDDATIKKTVKKYGKLDAFALIDLTHESGGAWDVAFRKEGRNTLIDHEDIKREFLSG